MFASEFDVGRYNAGLVLLNAVSDPNHVGRLVVDTGRAEDFLVYGKPFLATSFDAINRRPHIWINQVGQFNVWPLKVLPLSQCETTRRARAEALIPAIASLDPQSDLSKEIRIEYDLPLFWKLTFAVGTFVVFLLVGIILYINLGVDYPLFTRSSWLDPMFKRFEVSSSGQSRKNLFLIALLLAAVGVPYCLLVAPLDLLSLARAAQGAASAMFDSRWAGTLMP